MTKINQKSVYNVKKSHILGKIVLIWTIFWFILCLVGCAKTPTETATETALQQADAIEAKVAKECPQISTDKDFLALKGTIKTQLATCESYTETLKAKNNTLWLAIIAMIGLWLMANWVKIKTRFFK